MTLQFQIKLNLMKAYELEQELALIKEEFQNTIQVKNNEIIQLQHALNRAQIKIKTLTDRYQFLEEEHKVLNQKFKQQDLYVRERAKLVNQKNLKIMQLEEQIDTITRNKDQEIKKQVDKLMEVIVGQEQELSLYMQDHQNYLEELERVSIIYKQNQAEKKLLSQYNEELEKQISEVETHSSSLESWVVKAHDQLQSQNQQSGDLLCQVQQMVYVMEGSE